MESQLISAVNAEREKEGLCALVSCHGARKAAWDHCRDMAMHDRLDHTGTDGRIVGGRLDRRRVDWIEAGENVARNKGYDSPIGEAVRAWMASPEHRKNILSSRFTETGVAISRSPVSGAYYFTQVFVRSMPPER